MAACLLCFGVEVFAGWGRSCETDGPSPSTILLHRARSNSLIIAFSSLTQLSYPAIQDKKINSEWQFESRIHEKREALGRHWNYRRSAIFSSGDWEERLLVLEEFFEKLVLFSERNNGLSISVKRRYVCEVYSTLSQFTRVHSCLSKRKTYHQSFALLIRLSDWKQFLLLIWGLLILSCRQNKTNWIKYEQRHFLNSEGKQSKFITSLIQISI